MKFLKLIIIKSAFIGSCKTYFIYKKLFKFALTAMNKGRGSHINNSGEEFIIDSLLKSSNTSDKIIFDVGANVGDFSKIIQKYNGINLHAFEPSLLTFNKYCENVNCSQVIANNIGLSDRNSESYLYSNKDYSGIASFYKRDLEHIGINFNFKEVAKFETLDNYCINNFIKNIFLLKIDVEGHELNVLKGSTEMLGSIKYILFEFGGCNIDSRTYFKDLYFYLINFFKIYIIMIDGLVEIKEYSELEEIFITTNYLAINKK
jgi:FkbM family methyltransferase